MSYNTNIYPRKHTLDVLILDRRTNHGPMNGWILLWVNNVQIIALQTFENCDLCNVLLRLVLKLTFIIIWLSLHFFFFFFFHRMPRFLLCNIMQRAMPRTFNRLVQRRQNYLIFLFGPCIQRSKEGETMKWIFSVVHIRFEFLTFYTNPSAICILLAGKSFENYMNILCLHFFGLKENR